MAWNKPGGNGKNPWNGNGQQPPDLDEMMQNFQNKFGNFFGNKKQSSGPSIGIILSIVALIWAAFGIYIVEPAEKAVVLRFGKYTDTVGPGPHWMMPLIDKRYTVDVDRIRSYTRSGVMLTQDENIVDIKLEVQYKVKNAQKYVLAIREPDEVLKHVTESALRQVVGKTNLHDVLTIGRAKTATDTKMQLQELLDRYQTGLEVTQANMAKSDPPTQVKEAFDDVIKAREDKERIINEAEAYENQILPLARGQAKRMEAEALAYKERVIKEAEGNAKRFDALLAEYEKAPAITKERLYIEAYESVLSNTSKVMVDVKGNNLMMLPLDKIIGSSSVKSVMPSTLNLPKAPSIPGMTHKGTNDSAETEQAQNNRFDLSRLRRDRQRGYQ